MIIKTNPAPPATPYGTTFRLVGYHMKSYNLWVCQVGLSDYLMAIIHEGRTEGYIRVRYEVEITLPNWIKKLLKR